MAATRQHRAVITRASTFLHCFGQKLWREGTLWETVSHLPILLRLWLIISGFQEKSPERALSDCLVWRVPLILEVLFDKIANSVPARGHLFEETVPDEFLQLFAVFCGDLVEADAKPLEVIVVRPGFDRIQNG